MLISVEQLRLIAGGRPSVENMRSIVVALTRFGGEFGLDRPHRLAHFIAQVGHESGGFRFDREVWGPTPAQKRYDTRTDLGNTPEADGDGQKNAGRGPIQLTGGGNILRFESWCRARGYEPPDLSGNPDLINTDPWEGLSAFWYWSVGNPTGKSLNAYADENIIEQITKKINGGLNGFEDRLRYYTRAALVLLGYKPDQVRAFQTKAFTDPKEIDGDPGPKTRAKLHLALVEMMPAHHAEETEVKAAPVVQTETETVAVVPKAAEHRTGLWTWGTTALAGMGGQILGIFGDWPWQAKVALAVMTLAGIAFLLFKGEMIVRRAKAILKEIES